MSDEKLMASALSSFHALVGHKILIHGGGKQANELCEKLGIQPNMHNGRRITDDATLDIAVMVYAGLANKKVVSKLQQFGTNAIGLSGADANVIRATKRPVQDIDYGWAGDIKSVERISYQLVYHLCFVQLLTTKKDNYLTPMLTPSLLLLPVLWLQNIRCIYTIALSIEGC